VKVISPLLGFNNNVKHKGRIFHIQTEDSGLKYPHIITHLFADGGRIVKSKKTDYSEHVGRPEVTSIIRNLMKEQHKAMFVALRDGSLDELIEYVIDGRPAPPQKPSVVKASVRPSGEPRSPLSENEQPGLRQRPPSAELRKLAPDPFQPPQDESVEVQVPELPHDSQPARPTPVLGTVDSSQPPGRYVAARPAAIFAPDGGGEAASLFGGSSLSEQSLDDVILSYLSDEVTEEPAESSE
jgi:hypothetical protein